VVPFFTWWVLDKCLNDEKLRAARTLMGFGTVFFPLVVLIIQLSRYLIMKAFNPDLEMDFIWVCLAPCFVAILLLANWFFIKRAMAKRRQI